MTERAKAALALAGIVAIVATVCLVLGLDPAARQAAAARAELQAQAYEEGLADGLRAARAPAPDCSSAPLPAELSALVECRAHADGLRRTQRANEENARLRGWDEGYRLGREDWRAQPWECRAFR